MRYLLISILFVLAFCSCRKEDELTNELDFSNVFEITNNPNDAVQSARYEIYTKYNVSVYFNDTVGQQLIRYDINGNPYYRYETLDMPWTFFDESGTDENVTYRYFYTEGEERQLKALERISAFLETLNEKMRPAILMAVDSVYLVRTDGVVSDVIGHFDVSEDPIWGGVITTHEAGFRSNFRYMLITSLADISDEVASNLYVSLTRDLALSKIYNFSDKLSGFGNITPDDYGRTGIFEYPENEDLPQVLQEQKYTAGLIYYGRPGSMFNANFEEFVEAQYISAYYPDYVEESRELYASIVGPSGFVMPEGNDLGSEMIDAPKTVDDDIESFVQLALTFTPAEVEHYWGGYPLVMRKYNIIKDILENDMNLNLEEE